MRTTIVPAKYDCLNRADLNAWQHGHLTLTMLTCSLAGVSLVFIMDTIMSPHHIAHCHHYSPPQACDRVPVGAGRPGHQHTLRPGAECEAALLQQDTGGGGGDLAPAQTHPPALQLQLRPRLCASVSFVLCFDEKYISCAYMFNDHFIIRENVG